MKSLLLSIAALLIINTAIAQATPVILTSNEVATAAISIPVTEHQFGAVIKGEPVTHRFEISNSGSAPLIITEVSKPCGCQKASWTKQAIAPGEKGFIEATYNASKEGAFVKSFTVKHNGEGADIQLVLRGKVEASTKSVVEETGL
ncbi:MAG: hypothetical protein ACI959_000727 [Limisphaerales bacterium]|jgi:hypothetical protein